METRKGKIRIELVLLILAIICILVAVIAAIATSGSDDPKQVQATATATAALSTPTATALPTAEPSPNLSDDANDQPVPPSVYDSLVFDNLQIDQWLEGTGLILNDIARYSGQFIENGTDEYVSDIFAILLSNGSGTDIEYATLSFTASDGRPLTFTLSNLPKDGSIIVLEANKTPYSPIQSLSLDSQQIVNMPTMSTMSDSLYISSSDNKIALSNTTTENLDNICVYYKYLYDSKTLLGGITYQCRIGSIATGSGVSASPSHYLSDSSRIMQIIQTEQTP